MRTLTQPREQIPARCLVIGHRGAAATCPENTLFSFVTARDTGAHMIELDVQQSVDEKLIVFHDETLERLCREPTAVGSLPESVLMTKVVGQRNEQLVTIPSLAQVFSTLRDSLLYNVELKTDAIHYPGIEARLVSLVRTYGLSDQVLVSSFNHESLRLVRQYDQQLSLGLLLDHAQAQQCGNCDGIVVRAREYACFSVHPEFSVLRDWPDLGARCHAAGLRIFPWTVDNEDDWRFLVEEVDVDGIITNDPGRLHGWLVKHAERHR